MTTDERLAEIERRLDLIVRTQAEHEDRIEVLERAVEALGGKA